MNAARSFFLGSFLFLALLSWNCKKDESNPIGPSSPGLSDAITTAPSVDGGSVSIPPTGGTLTVAKSGSPIDGLQLQVPANAYSETRTFQISYAQVQNHKLGMYFNPVSPLITVANGGGYAGELMTLKIPAKVPQGYFAMAFMYDPASGELEGLPLADADSSSVTVVTRHFAHSSEPGSIGGSLKEVLSRISGQDLSASDIIVTSIPQLDLSGTYESPFRPGIDDWGFTNWGSYAAPKGHCAGQSIGALWYYDEKRLKGDPPLWNRFDNDGNTPATPGFWQDDVRGYKFCSVLQQSQDWSSWSRKIFASYQHAEGSLGGKRAMNLFAYALLLTRKPQLVYLASSPQNTSHAILAYKSANNVLSVCDPNFPGATDRTIVSRGSYFDPYYSGDNAGALGTPYTLIEYIGVSAVIDWKLIGERWQQVADGSIGNDLFPAYTIKVLNDSATFVSLHDGFMQKLGEFSLFVSAPGFQPSFQVFNDSRFLLAKDSSFQLSPGSHRIGVCVSDTGRHWVGFQWLTVISGDTANGPHVDFSQFNRLEIALIAKLAYSSGSVDGRVSFSNKLLDGAAELFSPLVWSGSAFSVSYSYTNKRSPSDYDKVNGSMSGTVSLAALKLVSVQAAQTVEQRGPGTGNFRRHVDSLSLSNVPLDTLRNFGVEFQGSGATLTRYVVSMFHSEIDSTYQPYRETHVVVYDNFTSLSVDIFKQE